MEEPIPILEQVIRLLEAGEDHDVVRKEYGEWLYQEALTWLE